jgi:hypothetical protein
VPIAGVGAGAGGVATVAGAQARLDATRSAEIVRERKGMTAEVPE